MTLFVALLLFAGAWLLGVPVDLTAGRFFGMWLVLAAAHGFAVSIARTQRRR